VTPNPDGPKAGAVATSKRLSPDARRGLERLWEYVKHHGTTRVPRSYRTEDDHRLGDWVSRRRKCRGQSAYLDQLLESLPGWTWSLHEQGFAEQLKRYQEAASTGRLHRSKASTTWASHQRRAARKGALPADRLERLREAGIL
jgi:hypothetical protein